MSVIDRLHQKRERLIALRHELHAHPELSFEEARTSELVARTLSAAGIEVHRGLAGTGVIGLLKCGDSPRMIGLRADMDALPIQEQNLFPHRSKHDGKMHACGHDGHTAMLLAAAEHLAETKSFDGSVAFIFQPAEETVGGARVMIEEGLFERFPVERVFGMHNWPGLPAGQFAIHSGPVMACADQFDITLRGHGAHAAMPHQGFDPVVAGAALVQALQGVVSRNVDPLDAVVLSITRFQAGEAYNVIPDVVTLGGTVRAFRPEVQDQAEAAMERICAGIGAAHGVQVALDYRRGYPPTVNTTAEAETCRRVIAQLVGEPNARTDLRPSMGAEDFAYMLKEKPGCYVWIGNGLGEGGCMLHNPHYDFNDDILTLGASYWVRLVEHLLAKA
ncbi:hippurate hydrolase [Sulfuritortus calidifontis]|uniref:Hippurate hydrolase n=1 Tax=Sulfuritortus calidifontis TaxID=1914471 RepID=A0A4R3JWZ3_9PROT|nr:M20 aminoacylase family protein [Sulfuritortus calidifontis]TCS72730.1 hippurate hydrolase [Sulfuritortus calidifontis]